MPSYDLAPDVSERTTKERAALGRYLFDKLIYHFHPRTLPDANHVFDDALTAFLMTSISPSEKSVESTLHYWLTFLVSIVQEQQLHKDAPNLSEDEKEERRRSTRIIIIQRTTTHRRSGMPDPSNSMSGYDLDAAGPATHLHR
ncbi:uncharacterized protein N7479_007020 [Penicillium vulpinum]|uniref:uncharacterized protein n=1 Tax=Penicillium vulpinum TaxID=29845 RepID=UPI002548F6D8|nr:uncharacterized protein N7479_007020 [Penicillium vulpinum]KAJ5959870.1 hypothetical protein N7479_007020 [Penicillium vulpinum]